MTDKEICEMYKQGKSISYISKNFNISYGYIQKILGENQIAIRGGRKKKELPLETLGEFKKDYLDYVTFKDMSKKYNLSIETVKRLVKELNFPERGIKRVNKHLKSDYFSKIDAPEKAYWLGFLYTDGSVDKSKGSGRIRLQLQNEDIEILEKFKQDLGIESKIIKDKRERSQCSSVEFVDEQIYQDLVNFGIIPNKTYQSHSIPFNNIPKEYIEAFLLGLYDGDGCLTYSSDFSTDVTFGFTSCQEMCALDFQREIDKLINKNKHNKPVFTTAWHVNWRGRIQVLNILDRLYEKSPRHLERKYQKYLKLKQSLE